LGGGQQDLTKRILEKDGNEKNRDFSKQTRPYVEKPGAGPGGEKWKWEPQKNGGGEFSGGAEKKLPKNGGWLNTGKREMKPGTIEKVAEIQPFRNKKTAKKTTGVKCGNGRNLFARGETQQLKKEGKSANNKTGDQEKGKKTGR